MPKTASAPSKAPTKAPPYHHGSLREALVESALAVMTANGHSHFSLSELARTVGVTPAAVYKHYADKDALLHELARHGFALLGARFAQAAPLDIAPTNKAQALDRFHKLGQAYLSFGLAEPALLRLIFGAGAAGYRKRFAQSTQPSPTFSVFAATLADLHRFGLIGKQPTAEDQWFAWSAIHGATELAVSGVGTLVPAQHTAKVVSTRIIQALA